MSYNSRGFSDQKINFIRHLMSSAVVGFKIPILCLQEHFILKGNSYKIKQSLPECHVAIKPAIKEVLDKGRPRNGMAIVLPESFKNSVIDVSPHYWRVQAVQISCQTTKLLLINSYFPNDEFKTNVADIGELLETLEVIRKVIRDNDFDSLLLLGDLNAEFLRKSQHCL